MWKIHASRATRVDRWYIFHPLTNISPAKVLITMPQTFMISKTVNIEKRIKLSINPNQERIIELPGFRRDVYTNTR